MKHNENEQKLVVSPKYFKDNNNPYKLIEKKIQIMKQIITQI